MSMHLHSQIQKPVIVIHGGAGTILKENMTPQLEKEYYVKLEEALKAGYNVLENGGAAEEAVVASIMVMEDSPLFNAGKGAVFTHDEKNEMDASIMRGRDLQAGAVAGVHRIKNPILGAKAVMERSEHVMLVGAGAEEFAKLEHIELVNPEYFHHEIRYQQLQRIKKSDRTVLDHDSTDGGSIQLDSSEVEFNINLSDPDKKFGTVGCVALDTYGNLAAGTSTGGMTNKRFNRIGDSPIIGAGTYADNATCAVSCTGHGEFFIRYVAAYDVAARMKYKSESLHIAASGVIDDLLDAKGMGGMIALDAKGNISMPFNTAGMYRGYIDKDGKLATFIYKP